MAYAMAVLNGNALPCHDYGTERRLHSRHCSPSEQSNQLYVSAGWPMKSLGIGRPLPAFSVEIPSNALDASLDLTRQGAVMTARQRHPRTAAEARSAASEARLIAAPLPLDNDSALEGELSSKAATTFCASAPAWIHC